MFIILIGFIAGSLIALAIKGIFFNKLPEWVNLTGQAYIDWKNGKSSKPESDE